MSDDDQTINHINYIKSQLHSIEPGDIKRLQVAVSSLLACDISPELKDSLKSLQVTIDEREKQVEGVIAYKIEEENREAAIKCKEALEAIENAAREKAIDAIYSKFDSFHQEFLTKQQEENKNLDEVSEVIKSGRDISEELKKKLLKTPEEIAEERAKWQHIALTRQTAHTEHEHCLKELEKIDAGINLLQDHEYERRNALHKDKDHFVARKAVARTEIEKTGKHYQEREHIAKKITTNLELAHKHGNQENIDFLKKNSQQFQEIHGISHEQVAQGAKQEKEQEKQIQKRSVSKVAKQEEHLEEHLEEARSFVYNNFAVDQYPDKVRMSSANMIGPHIKPTILAGMQQEKQALVQGKNYEIPKHSLAGQMPAIDKPTSTPNSKQAQEQDKNKSTRWER